MALCEMLKLDDRWVNLTLNNCEWIFGNIFVMEARRNIQLKNELDEKYWELAEKYGGFNSKEVKDFENEHREYIENDEEITIANTVFENYLLDHNAVVEYTKFKPHKQHDYNGNPYGKTEDEQITINKDWNNTFRKKGWLNLKDDDFVPLIDRQIYRAVGNYQFKLEKRLYNCMWCDCYILENETDMKAFIFLDLMEMRRFKYNLRWCSNCYLPFIQHHKKEKYCCPKCQTQGKSHKNKEFKQTPMGKRHQIMNYLYSTNTLNEDIANIFYGESADYIKNHNEYESMQWLDSKHKEFKVLSKAKKIKHT